MHERSFIYATVLQTRIERIWLGSTPVTRNADSIAKETNAFDWIIVPAVDQRF
jgi:hypothetical protein